MDITVCEGDSATFLCLIFISSGIPSNPGWLRNGAAVVMMRHTVAGNVTDGTTAPVYISSTITVNGVTVLDDDGVMYQCGVGSNVSSGATLNVVGM